MILNEILCAHLRQHPTVVRWVEVQLPGVKDCMLQIVSQLSNISWLRLWFANGPSMHVRGITQKHLDERDRSHQSGALEKHIETMLGFTMLWVIPLLEGFINDFIHPLCVDALDFMMFSHR